MNLNKSNSILTTKFQKPSLPGDFIAKQKLFDYVNDNIERPFTLISAGGGFGKSTFVNSWLSKLPYKSSWLSLDVEDNEIRTFLTYFITAIQREFPEFGIAIQSLLQSEQIPPLNIFVKQLINELNDLSKPLFFAIDDFHVITDPGIIELFSTILKYPPANLHLILITRCDPPLQLSKLRAQNRMKDIRSSHLRMNEDETRQFIQYHIKTGDVNSLAKMLDNHLEGWITGLRLAMFHLSLQPEKSGDYKTILTQSNLTEEYFLKEILDSMDAKTLGFLLTTSILQKFSPQLAAHLLATSEDNFDSCAIVSDLVKKNMFIINLDDERQWYRYHHLFQSLLQKELQKRYNKETIINLHKRASQWYDSVSSVEDAFFHASHIKDYEQIALLIEKHMHSALNQHKWYDLERWLKKIPVSYIYQRPALIIGRMWVLHHKNSVWAIPELLQKLEELRLNSSLDSEIELQIRFFRGIILFWTANIEESLVLFDKVRKNLSKDQLGARSLADIYYATASQMNGTGKEVYLEIEKIMYSNNQSTYYQIILNGALVYMKLIEGDLFASEQNSLQAYERGQSANDIFGTVWGKYFLGYAAFQQSKYEIAEECFRYVIENIYIINMVGSVDSFAGMMLSQFALNKTDDLEKTLDHFISYVNEQNDPTFMTIAYSVRARLALLNKDTESAKQLINMANMDFDSGTMLFYIETPRITHCRVLLAQNTPETTNEALNKLQEHLALAEKTRNIPKIIDLQVLRAVGYWRKNNIEKAREAIYHALINAIDGNWVRPFEEVGSEISNLFSLVDADSKAGKFASVLLAKLSENNVTTDRNLNTENQTKNAYDLNQLSNRELDVITLLAKRFSNKEIAGELYISESTVKRHTITIYQKLGVNKRRNAVVKAREMGIIPD